ncbi:MAG: ABC transporter permease [Paenibacillaceae bacterium]
MKDTSLIQRKDGRVWNTSIVTMLIVYLCIPVAGTLAYSLCQEWQGTILPKGFTLKWYAEIFSDTRFLEAMGRSLLVSTITVVISLLIMIPTIFIIVLYYPKLERTLQILVLLPFAFPGVVAAVGLIKVYSSGPLAISGTIWILIGAYFIVVLPYVYQSTRNSLRTINAKDLMDAAEVLGASKVSAFHSVIVPNILPGVLTASLLSFSTILGEFVLANILVGGSYETIQIYLLSMMRVSGHSASAIILIFFVLVFVLSAIILKLGSWNSRTNVSKGKPKEEDR